jgi:hypothetical protein
VRAAVVDVDEPAWAQYSMNFAKKRAIVSYLHMGDSSVSASEIQ